MRRLTISAMELLLGGSGFQLRSSGVNGSRRYWLEGTERQLIPGSESLTLEGIRSFVHSADQAA